MKLKIFITALYGTCVNAYTRVAVAKVDCETYKKGGAIVWKDCNIVMNKTETDRNQDFEFTQDDWKLTWWKDEGEWARATLQGPNGYRETVDLYSTYVGINRWSHDGAGCTKSGFEELDNLRMYSFGRDYEWLKTNLDTWCFLSGK